MNSAGSPTADRGFVEVMSFMQVECLRGIHRFSCLIQIDLLIIQFTEL